MTDISKRFVIDGYEYRPVILVDPDTGIPYRSSSTGGTGGTGDASAAKQDVSNASLANIDTKTPAPVGGAWPVFGTVSINNFPVAFQVSNFPGTQPVSGPLTDTQLRAATVPVSGAFFQATQPVSGPLTDAQLRASAVPMSLASVPSHAVTGPLTDTQLRAATVPVSGTVSVGNFPGTQPVSGPLTDTQLRAATVPVSGAFFQATQPVSGPLTDAQLRAATVPVSGAFFQATQPVSGAFFQATQPVSAAALPLPAGAATETTLAAFNAKFAALGQATMTASSPVVLASNHSAIPKTSVPSGATLIQVTGIAGGIVNTAAVLVAAAVASNRHYLRSLQVSNGSTTVSSELVLLDGTTVIWRGFVGTAAQSSGTRDLFFDPPLRVPTLNTALNIQCITTAMALRWAAQGWTAP